VNLGAGLVHSLWKSFLVIAFSAVSGQLFLFCLYRISIEVDIRHDFHRWQDKGPCMCRASWVQHPSHLIYQVSTLIVIWDGDVHTVQGRILIYRAMVWDHSRRHDSWKASWICEWRF
jgi:hypothetical protein